MQKSGRDRALDYLRNVVLADPDLQGCFLNEVDLAKRIGVSRTPVREALLLLVADGLVEMLPGRGAYIPPFTGRQVYELMEMRAVFERYAASRVIAIDAVPVHAMRGLLAEQRSLATTGDVGSAESAALFIAKDADFHQTLVDAAGNSMLARSYVNLRVRQRRIGVVALFRDADRQLAVCTEHGEIVEALADRDEPAALAAIDNHLQRTTQVLLQA